MTRQEFASTPIRTLKHEEVNGCRVLPGWEPLAYLDGSEGRLLRLLQDADDVGPLSDELEQSARNWAERYHLSKSRANILRPFRLTRRMRVLDVGGGCGAIARYLGEVCGTVDVIEPVLDRAAVARARTRDLANVEVFVANPGQLPDEPAYDLVVLVGVLEYAAAGSRKFDSYADFIGRLSASIRPGGHLLCAIENRLGVKYLAGSPEDHSGRPFDGLEDYPEGGVARTFSRAELTRLFRAASLEPLVYHAFPDYKLARAVLTDDLLQSEGTSSLAWRIPVFPSPDWLIRRPRLADERSLWRSLVEAGVGPHFANSFVVVGSSAPARPLWPPDVLAAFYSTQRRAQFCTQTLVRKTGEAVVLERRLLASKRRRVESAPVSLRVEDTRYLSGCDMVDVLARGDDGSLAASLERWRGLVHESIRQSPENHGVDVDLVPSNLLVRGGEIQVIDQEWRHREYTARDVLERGVLWVAIQLAQITPPGRWPVARVRDLAVMLGAIVGLDSGGAWLHRAVEREAELQAHVHSCSPFEPGWERAVADHRRALEESLTQRLEDMPLGEREHQKRGRLEAHLAETGRALAEKDGHISNFQQTVAAKDLIIADLQAMVGERDSLLAERDAHIREISRQIEALRRTPIRRAGRFARQLLRSPPYQGLRRFVRRLTTRGR